MSTSLTYRSAAIKDWLSKMEKDPIIARRYSLIAARWEELRLAMDKGQTTPGDDRRFRELSDILKPLTEQLGLPRPAPSRVVTAFRA